VNTKMLPRGTAIVGRCGILIVLGAAIWFEPAAAKAELYGFVKIADTSGQYTSIDPWPTVNGSGQVVFVAALRSGGCGLYMSDGGTTTTLDQNPGIFRTDYYGTDQVVNNAGEVAFFNGWAQSATSVFRWSAGTITTIAGTGSISSIEPWNPSINDNGTVVFGGVSRTTGRKGIYSGNGGALTTVIDTAGAFSDFGLSPAVNDSGTVAFSALSKASGKWGVYTLGSSGVLTTIADTEGFIADLGAVPPTINDAGQVAFFANLKSGATAILRGDGSKLDVIADSTGAYDGFESQPMINNLGKVGFIGYTKSAMGIYTGPDPIADKIVATGDLVNGSVLDSFQALGFSFGDNNNATFLTYRSNGYELYAAHPVPEPSALVLLGIGVFGLSAATGRRCRRRA
jgi:hypothetical protein